MTGSPSLLHFESHNYEDANSVHQARQVNYKEGLSNPQCGPEGSATGRIRQSPFEWDGRHSVWDPVKRDKMKTNKAPSGAGRGQEQVSQSP